MDHHNYKLVSLIYEAAEDIECWPKILEAYRNELIENHQNRYLGQQTSLVDKAISLKETDIPTETLSHNDQELLKHLQRALRINRKIDALHNKVGTTQGILNYLPLGILTVDSQGTVINANTVATNLLNNSDLLYVKNHQLVTYSPKSTAALMKIIADAMDEPESSQTTCALKVCNGHNDNTLSLFAVRSTPPKNLKNHTKLCTLFIATNLWSYHISTEILSELYQLTPAESRLAKTLAKGVSISEASKELNISQHTVRNQLKAIFSKTGTHRQSELLGLMFSTPVLYQTELSETNLDKSCDNSISKKTQSIVLEDGRCLAYAEYGDHKGVPVFYSHCVVIWPWWSISKGQTLSELGVRLIVPYRAGYGESTFHQQASLESYARDVQQLANALGLAKFFVLGFSSGGAYASACAYYLPQRCLGLSLVSSIAPIDHLAELEMMKPAMSRLSLGFARHAKRLYTSFFKMLIKSIVPNSKSYITHYISQWSTYDKHLITQPHILQSIHKCFLDVVDNGAAGLIHESPVIANSWGFSLSDIKVSTTIWRGENDLAVPPPIANKLSDINHATIQRVSNGGHLHILEFGDKILSDIINRQKNI